MSSLPRDAPVQATDGDLSNTIIAVATVSTGISLILVGLRFYVRGRLLYVVGTEDWCILAAWVSAAISGGFVIQEARVALGHHFAAVTPAAFSGYLHAAYFMTVFYNLSLCFTKISILILYLRVLKTYDYMRTAIQITLGIVVVYNVWAFGMEMTMCIPLQKMWNPSVAGYCHPLDVWWALTYIHIITDFLIFLLPIPTLLPMMIPLPQKLGLLIVFCVGFFVCLISVLRTIWLKLLYPEAADITWELASIANWSMVEINVAIVCACLVTLKPLFKRLFGPLVDRFFPTQGRSPNNASSRPLTIGSVPLKAINRNALDPLEAVAGIGSTASIGTGTTQAVSNREETCAKSVLD